MKRPWQVWLLYALSLAAVVPAMAWLTSQALELDQAERIARRQAELEEDVSRALWRMDALLTPLLAEEAARPDFVYRPLHTPLATAPLPGSPPKQPTLSPLLLRPAPHVLVHFELHADGRLTSPECPVGEQNRWALAHGADAATVARAAARLEELRGSLEHAKLLVQLPDESLQLANDDQGNEGGLPGNYNGNTVVANAFAPNAAPGQQQLARLANEPETASPSANPLALPSRPVQQAFPNPAAQGDESSSEEQGQFGQNYESGRLQRSQSRQGNDLFNRDAAFQAYAQKAVVEQRNNLKEVVQPAQAIEGISRPLWIDSKLILARRVQNGTGVAIQGCWLDWNHLRTMLRAEVADLLPEARLAAVRSSEPIKLSRLLATLPVELSVPAPAIAPAGFSPIRVSLLVAWGCLLAVALLGAAMLQSIVTLSERRGAFVAAVTHELRTPLTTFRMYAEMLAEGMVPAAEQRQQYLETLRVEADRLHHLVENVLQYARLERGRPGRTRQRLALGGLIERLEPRLAERAAQAGMKLVVEQTSAAADATLLTDSAAVEQVLFNLVDNACKYAAQAADKRIHLQIECHESRCRIAVRDHGPGIGPPGRRKLFQPFSKSVHEAASTAPGVGLGLALSYRLARDLGGRLEYLPAAETGAAFVLTLPR